MSDEKSHPLVFLLMAGGAFCSLASLYLTIKYIYNIFGAVYALLSLLFLPLTWVFGPFFFGFLYDLWDAAYFVMAAPVFVIFIGLAALKSVRTNS